MLNLRFDAFDVEVVKNYADSFLGLSVEEVVALGVPGIVARVIGRREGSVLRLVAVVRKAARVLWLLSARRYSKIFFFFFSTNEQYVNYITIRMIMFILFMMQRRCKE